MAAARAQLGTAAVEIAHLRAQLAAQRRQQYCQSSERLDAEIAQLELRLEELEENEAEQRAARPNAASRDAPLRPRAKAVRRPLPDHLPRETVVDEPTTLCTCCEPGKLARLGEDVTEVLEKIPARLPAPVPARPALACELRSVQLRDTHPGSRVAWCRRDAPPCLHPQCRRGRRGSQGPGHGAAGADPQGETLAGRQVEAHAGGALRAELGVGKGPGVMSGAVGGRRPSQPERRLPTRASYHI